MGRLGSILNNTRLWSSLIAGVIATYLLVMTAASIGPPILAATISNTDGNLSIGDVAAILPQYIDSAAKETGIEAKTIRNSMIASALLVLPALIVFPFVLRREEWARKVLVGLLILLIAMPILVSQGNMKSARYIVNAYTLAFVIMIWYLQKKTTKDAFIGLNSDKSL